MTWKPFQLRPDTPIGGVLLSEMLPPEYLERAEAQVQAAAREAGLPLNRYGRVPNTHLAHEAGAFATAHGHGDAFHQAALRANFAEAKDVGDLEVLAQIGASVGLDAQALRSALESGSYREAVDRELAEAREQGISGVPAFVFGGKYLVTGAQPYEYLERVMAALGG